jgi:hypothetical protein
MTTMMSMPMMMLKMKVKEETKNTKYTIFEEKEITSLHCRTLLRYN